MNGAVALAESGDRSSPETGQSTSSTGRDDETDRTPSTETPASDDDESGTAGPDDGPANTSVDEDDRPRSLSSALAEAADDMAAVDTESDDIPENAGTDPVIDIPTPAGSASSSDTAVASHSSDAVDTASSAPAQNAAEPASHAATISTPAPVAHPDPPPPPDQVPAPVAQAPAATTAAPPAPPITALDISQAVAYLLGTLATATLDVVNAIIQLVADLRATLGIPALTPERPGDAPPSGAILLSDSIVVILTKILSRSWPTTAGPSALRSALAAGAGLLSWTAALRPTAPAPDGARPDCPHPVTIPLPHVVTALAAMSLWALLSGALPGLGGLLAFAATGVRIGHRQARAQMALRTTALARFVRAGPIGIVTGGARVSVHPRTAPADHPRWGRHLKLVS